MPHPDPSGLDIEERPDGSFAVTTELWFFGNPRHRLARMYAVARNIARAGWRCWRCSPPRRCTTRCGNGFLKMVHELERDTEIRRRLRSHRESRDPRAILGLFSLADRVGGCEADAAL